MQITINNQDTQNIHVDTYHILTGDSADELTIEYENENKKENEPDLTYDDFDWIYDHKQIVKDFAHASIEIINQAIKGTDYAKIITDIQYIDSFSPKFYNYTTDGYTMLVTVDEKALTKYIDDNHAAIVEKTRAYDDVYSYTPESEISQKNIQHAAVCHILDNAITADDYNMAMWEQEYEVYSNNTTYTLITLM